MVTVKTYPTLAEAFLDRTRLNDAGIPAFIADEHSATLGHAAMFQDIRLQVPEAHRGEALAILFGGKAVMKVWQTDGPGKPSRLRLTQDRTPAPGRGQYLVRLLAAGINPVDWKGFSSGRMARLLGIKFPHTPGYDYCGVIEEAGPGAERFCPGDRVMGMRRRLGDTGTLAEYAVVAETGMVLCPEDWEDAFAAALPLAGLTAWQALRRIAPVPNGGRVLILGGSSAVGFIGAHLAIDPGAGVTMVCGPANAGWLRGAGNWEVVSYVDPFPSSWDRSFDVVLDAVGSYGWRRSRAWLRGRGRYVSTLPDAGLLLHQVLRVLLPWGRRGGLVLVKPDAGDLEQLAAFVAKNRGRLRIERVYDFEEAPEALERSRSGRATGKLVVRAPSGGA